MRSTSYLLRGSVGLGALTTVLLSSAAMAQDYTAPLPEAPAAAPEASDSAIVVTGTRIKRADLQSNSPLSVVSAQELQYQGTTNVEAALNRMPQFTPTRTRTCPTGLTARRRSTCATSARTAC